MSDIWERTKTAIAMVLAVCAVLLFSHVDWFLRCAVIILSFLGVWELYGAVKLEGTKGIVALLLTVSVAVIVSPYCGYPKVVSIAFPVYVILGIAHMLLVGKQEKVSLWCSIAMGMCITLFFWTAAELRTMEQGFYLLTAPILTCALTDVAAYFVGRRFGKRKLAPKISPKKTVAGFVGGTVVSVLVMLLTAAVLEASGVLKVRFGKLTVYLILTSLVGQLGDLFLSAVKRICGIKDFASWFPGHGGVLDRCDSHLAALPFTYLFVTYAGTFLT